VTRRQQTTTPYPAFAERLRDACDKAGAPTPDQGRSLWIRDQIERQFRERVTVEAVRKWLAGKTYPRLGRLTMLAAILRIEPGGLSGALGVGGVAEKGAPFQHGPELVEEDRGQLFLDRIRQRFAGTVTIRPGVDLTDPTWEERDDGRE